MNTDRVRTLRWYREQSLKTQQELADELGVWAQTVRNWELGKRKPRPSQQRRLAEVFRIAPHELLEAVAATMKEIAPQGKK